MNFKSILVVLFGFSIFDAALTVKSWGYRSPHLLTPNFWYQEYPTCAGLKQSPINIDPNIAKFSKNLQKIKIKPRGNFKEAWTIVNNAHTIRLSSNKKSIKKFQKKIFTYILNLSHLKMHYFNNHIKVTPIIQNVREIFLLFFYRKVHSSYNVSYKVVFFSNLLIRLSFKKQLLKNIKGFLKLILT